MNVLVKPRNLLGNPPPDSAEEVGRILSPAPISRRTFFSFFGVGAAMLAKPELFVPKRPRFITVHFEVVKTLKLEVAHVGWDITVQRWNWWSFPGKWLPLDAVTKEWRS